MKSSKILKISALALLTLGTSLAATAQKMWVWKGGGVVYQAKTALIDSVARTDTGIAVFDKQKALLWADAADSVSFTDPAPKADLLDVVWNADGTATDVSPMHNTVQRFNGGSGTVYYNSTWKRYVASFKNTWASYPSDYYRVDYNSNTDFRNRLADGHSLELLFSVDASQPYSNSEAKPFASHEAGGTGFLICTTSKAKVSGQHEITFLPNTSSTGSSTWRWATSGIEPKPHTYYHVVGVWNKTAGKASVYVNGELKNTVNAPGNFIFPKSGAVWWCIGGDASTGKGGNGFPGEVAIARVYDKPLTSTQVGYLWDDVKDLSDLSQDADLVTDVNYYDGLAVREGQHWGMTGKGFATGDSMSLVLTSDAAKRLVLPVNLAGVENSVYLVIPAGFAAGTYAMTLQRGSRTQYLGAVQFVLADSVTHGARVVAHRGYWDVSGASENSRASLRNAIALGCYGSETDVWCTTDGHLMINHNASIGGVTIQSSTYDKVKNKTLSNGELIPELSDLLDILKTSDSTKLIIEIKTHSTRARNDSCVTKTVRAVQAAGLESKVEYIAFDLKNCKLLHKLAPTAMVQYLNGDKNPAELYELGIMGLDYTYSVFSLNPSWVVEAHKRGMICNAWTVNDASTMIKMTNLGVDFITTNAPVEALKIKAAYDGGK